MKFFEKWTLIGVLFFTALTALSLASRETILDLENFPNPIKDFEKCGRKQESYICDPELYINPKSSDYLDELLINGTNSDLVWCARKDSSDNPRYGTINGIDRSKFELRGLQIGVTLISSFRNYDYVVPVTASYKDFDFLSKKYAKSIHDQWGVGDADCNNGIMILISIEDRVLYISTGKGVKNIITDDFIEYYIVSKIRSYMRMEKYDKAIIEMLDIIYEMLFYQDDQESSRIYKEWNRMKRDSNNNSDTLFSIFGIWDVTFEDCIISTIVIGFLGYIYTRHKRETEYRQCQNRLAAIYAQSQQRRFNQQSCPICLEDFGNNNNRPTSLLACGHKFCTQCLDEWFGNQFRTQHRCPVCRQHRDDLSNIPENIDEPTTNDTNNNVPGNDNAPKNGTNANNSDNNGTIPTNNTPNTDNTINDNNTNNNINDNNNSDESDSKQASNNDEYKRNDLRDNRRSNPNDFSDDFPSVDKNTNGNNQGSSTFYGSNTGAQGRREYDTNAQEREEERRRDNNFFRRYAAMNMVNDMMYRNDLNFRLRRMRHYYPRYIDDRMVHRWSQPGYNGGSFAQDTSFAANNPFPPPNPSSGSYRSSSWGARSSGGGGRSFSFGGGSSFGGGGGGGRW